MNRLVFDEQQASPEGLPTLLTLGGSVRSMDFLVLEEVFTEVEGRLAFGTFIAFPGVGLLMLSKMKGSAETLATLATSVGLTPCVGFLMLSRRGLVTILILRWFFFGMTFLMPQVVCFLTESCPVLGTHTGFVACVSHRRHKEARTLAETFLVLIMHSGLLSGMNNPVLDKVVTLAEALPTFTTFIQFIFLLDSLLLTLV